MAPKKKTTPKTNRISKQMQLKRRLQQRTIRQSASAQQNTYRGFLELPAELKNAIYEIWAHNETIYIRPSGADFLTTTHPIASLCHQTRDEFMSIMTQDATFAAHRIVAQVHDFNFYYVDQFMKLVAAEQRADLWDFTDGGEGGRELVVEFTLTESFCRDPPVERLPKWFRWMSSFAQHEEPLVDYRVRRVAEPEKALKIVENFARGHGQGRHPFVRGMVGLFRQHVEHVGRPMRVVHEDEGVSEAEESDEDEDMEDYDEFSAEDHRLALMDQILEAEMALEAAERS